MYMNLNWLVSTCAIVWPIKLQIVPIIRSSAWGDDWIWHVDDAHESSWFIFDDDYNKSKRSHDSQGFQTLFFSERLTEVYFSSPKLSSVGMLYILMCMLQIKHGLPALGHFAMQKLGPRKGEATGTQVEGTIHSHTNLNGWMDWWCFFLGGAEALLIVMIVMMVETLANHLECMKHVLHISSLVLAILLFHFASLGFKCC